MDQPQDTTVQSPRIPPPQLPLTGAAAAAPMTGQPVEPAVDTTTRPPMPSLPPRPAMPGPPRSRMPAQATTHPNQDPVIRPPGQPTVPTTAPPLPLQIPPTAGHCPPQGYPPQPMYPVGQMPAWPRDNQAMSSLLMQMVNMQSSPTQKFLLLVLPEDGWPHCDEFHDVQSLIGRIQQLDGTPCHVYPFLGCQLKITAAPNRYLITPVGPIPLFTLADPGDAAETRYGWLGPELDMPQPPSSEADDAVDDLVEAEPGGLPDGQPIYNQPPRPPDSRSSDPASVGVAGGMETPMFE